MLKYVQFIDYNTNYAYAPPDVDGVIQTDEIVKIKAIPKGNTRRPFDDICRIWFKNGSWMDVIGKPQDFVEIERDK